MIHTFQTAGELARIHHVPVLIHVTELTQPQGHSTSGSHERYKSQDRLKWENDYDCNLKFREWILENKIAIEDDLIKIEKSDQLNAKQAKDNAWEESLRPIRKEAKQLVECLTELEDKYLKNDLKLLLKDKSINRKKIASFARKIFGLLRTYPNSQKRT